MSLLCQCDGQSNNSELLRNALNSNRATEAITHHKKLCCYIKQFRGSTIKTCQDSYGDTTNQQLCGVHKCQTRQPLFNFAACVFIAAGSFPRVNRIWLRSTDNQWQSRTAVTVWQTQWKVRRGNSHSHDVHGVPGEYL